MASVPVFVLFTGPLLVLVLVLALSRLCGKPLARSRAGAAGRAPAEWRKAPRAQRRRIRRALRRGEPVRDPRDAELAIAYADHLLRNLEQRRKLRLVEIGLVVLSAAVLATMALGGGESRWEALWPALTGLTGVLGLLLGPRWERRLRRARDENASLGGFGFGSGNVLARTASAERNERAPAPGYW